MTAGNVAAYVEQPNINGGLVGGASLDPDGFAALIANAVILDKLGNGSDASATGRSSSRCSTAGAAAMPRTATRSRLRIFRIGERLLRTLSAHDARSLRRSGRSSRRRDGQQRGRAHEPRQRTRRSARRRDHRRRDRRRRLCEERDAATRASRTCASSGGTLHLMGLLSDGKVHSSIDASLRA